MFIKISKSFDYIGCWNFTYGMNFFWLISSKNQTEFNHKNKFVFWHRKCIEKKRYYIRGEFSGNISSLKCFRKKRYHTRGGFSGNISLLKCCRKKCTIPGEEIYRSKKKRQFFGFSSASTAKTKSPMKKITGHKMDQIDWKIHFFALEVKKTTSWWFFEEKWFFTKNQFLYLWDLNFSSKAQQALEKNCFLKIWKF